PAPPPSQVDRIAPSQVDRIAATYAGRKSPSSQSSTSQPPAPAAETMERQRAERDAVAPFLTTTQKVARMYGSPTSETIPAASPALSGYMNRARELGVDSTDARKALDAFLSLGSEQSNS